MYHTVKEMLRPILWCSVCFFFFFNTLSLCSRLANSQLEKEKEELIHQIEINKDQNGPESTISGNVFFNILIAC